MNKMYFWKDTLRKKEKNVMEYTNYAKTNIRIHIYPKGMKIT